MYHMIGTRAVVTGAGSGIGRAFCVALAERGARVLASDIDRATALATADQIRRAGGDAHAMQCDVTAIADVEALAAETERLWGGVDLVINNAGVAVGGRVGDLPLADWRWALDVNLWGVIHGCHVFAP